MIKTSSKTFGVVTLILLLSFTSFCFAQKDTVVINNSVIPCTIKEITPDAVKYSFPGEDVINTVYKNTVQKIIFKNGRVQTFAEATSFKVINNVMDYDKISITSVENEVKGLYKLSDVSSKLREPQFTLIKKELKIGHIENLKYKRPCLVRI